MLVASGPIYHVATMNGAGPLEGGHVNHRPIPAQAFRVPIVDMIADPPDAIVTALRSASCAFVVNHGVDEELLAEMVDVSMAFFDLPVEDKSSTRWPGDGLWRGWQPVYTGAAEYVADRLPDPLERFEIQLAGARGHDGAAQAALRRSFGLWPARPATFSDVWTRYYLALGDLAVALIERVIDTLDLPSDPAWRDEHYANLVAINYLAQPTPMAEGQLRARAHTDRGGLTLLWADQSPGGLEVLLPRSRDWVPVMIPPGAFLVQAGDLLTRWTNWTIRPNVHRVVNPPSDVAASSRRISIPYFHYPRLDAVVGPAPSCITDDRPPAKPVLARDHVFRRQEEYKGADQSGVDEVLALA
jgi:isopenicillin N synthase-like dioxygenase